MEVDVSQNLAKDVRCDCVKHVFSMRCPTLKHLPLIKFGEVRKVVDPPLDGRRKTSVGQMTKKP